MMDGSEHQHRHELDGLLFYEEIPKHILTMHAFFIFFLTLALLLQAVTLNLRLLFCFNFPAGRTRDEYNYNI